MALSRCSFLGAALAAGLGSGKFALSESTSETVVSPPRGEAAELVAKAKKVLANSQSKQEGQQKMPTKAPLTREEINRAQAVLDRYYSIAKEAEAANVPKKEPVEVKKETPKKSKSKRVAADQVFEDFDTTKVQGLFCKKYVICGGGTAAWAAIESILEVDPHAARDILLISEEEHHPYNRTVLSKELWEEKNSDVFRSEESSKKAVEYGYKVEPLEHGKVSAIRGKRVVQLDVDNKLVEISDGTKLQYNKLLIATGGKPKEANSVSPALASSELANHLSVFRTLDDYRELKTIVDGNDDGVVVIGGGFLGTELAVALASASKKVSLVVAEAGVLFRVLPRYMCEYLARRLSNIGVEVVRSAIITGATTKDNLVTLSVESRDAREVQGNKVLIAVGIDPSVEFVKDAGLEMDPMNGGIQVNDFMMIEPDVYAAGDVASFHDRSLGRRRVEHWDHAVVTGRIAGKNMAGQRERYGLQSMFWSDLSNLGVSFTAVGRVESELETIAVWNLRSAPFNGAPSANEYLSGVVYYVRDGEVVGVLLWNPKRGAGGLRRARALVDAKTRISDMDEATLAALVNLDPANFRTTIHTRTK